MSANTQTAVISKQAKLLQGHQDRGGQSSLAVVDSWKLPREVKWSKGDRVFAVSLCHQQMGIMGQQGRVLTQLSFGCMENKEWTDWGGKQENTAAF